jgi:hypothetical protein
MSEINNGGAVAIAGQLYEYVDLLGSKMFATKSGSDDENFQKKAVHQFALSVGIAGNFILLKKDWTVGVNSAAEDATPHPESNPGSQLATHENIEAILQLIAASGRDTVNVQVVSEYINGGLLWLKEIGFETQEEESLAKFFEIFPHIKGEGAEAAGGAGDETAGAAE